MDTVMMIGSNRCVGVAAFSLCFPMDLGRNERGMT